MNSIKIETKTNGYKAEKLQEMIAKFEKAAGILFPGCTVRHFYYGDSLDMADIKLDETNGGVYGCFNITENRVSFNSHCGIAENIRKFESMTYQDELFDGKLMEIAAKD